MGCSLCSVDSGELYFLTHVEILLLQPSKHNNIQINDVHMEEGEGEGGERETAPGSELVSLLCHKLQDIPFWIQ